MWYPSRSLNVLNRTPLRNRQTIVRCQDRFPLGVCHDYSCPFAGLKNISVDRVLDVIARSGGIPHKSTAPAVAVKTLEAAYAEKAMTSPSNRAAG